MGIKYIKKNIADFFAMTKNNTKGVKNEYLKRIMDIFKSAKEILAISCDFDNAIFRRVNRARAR